jgi:hypothetical protein
MANPDGTVQVAPPTMSAFAPQASPSAPPPPPQAQPGVAPGAAPGVAGAIQSAIAALVQAFAPKVLTQAKQRNDQAEAAAEGNAPAPLGHQF